MSIDPYESTDNTKLTRDITRLLWKDVDGGILLSVLLYEIDKILE